MTFACRFELIFFVIYLSHFISTERSPYERHLYKISLDSDKPASTKSCLTCPSDPEEHAYYSASFSPKSGYYILDYEGPGIPNTVVKKVDDASFRSVLQDNLDLRMLLQDYDLPKTHMRTVSSGGVGKPCVYMLLKWTQPTNTHNF